VAFSRSAARDENPVMGARPSAAAIMATDRTKIEASH